MYILLISISNNEQQEMKNYRIYIEKMLMIQNHH